MKRTFLPLALLAATGSMALAACNSAAENNAEHQADAVRDAADATAGAMENQADAMDTNADGRDSRA
jgi:hypothetical protein